MEKELKQTLADLEEEPFLSQLQKKLEAGIDPMTIL